MSDPLALSVEQVEALSEGEAAAVLAEWVKAGKSSLPEALSQSRSKPHAKLAKKALYQLRSSGAAVAPQRSPPLSPSEVLVEKEDEDLFATLSPILGTGDRALFFVRPVRGGGGVEIYQSIISDTLGILQFDRAHTNRATYRRRIKELRSQTELSLLFVPLERAIQELGRALSLNDRSRTNIPAEMADGLTRLGVVPLDPDWTLPPMDPRDRDVAPRSDALHDEPEIHQWMPAEQTLAEMAALPAELKHDGARARTQAEAFSRAFFTRAMRAVYGRRLWLTAEVFDASRRTEPANLARATARVLFHCDEPTTFETRLFLKAFELSARAPPADTLKRVLESLPAQRLNAPEPT